MGQPTPPGDMPLYDGLGPEWNDIVGAFPEDKRNELAPLLKSRIDETVKPYEPLKQYEDFAKSNIAPDHISNALNILTMIDNNPKQVYEAIGNALGITNQQAKEIVEEIEEGDQDDPRIQTMQQQIDTLAQIALAQRQQTAAEQRQAEQDAALNKELEDLKKKYGDEVDEEEVIMRMVHGGMSAEDAHLAYAKKVSDIRKRRPAPMIMGSGGSAVPARSIDPTKLDSANTKSLVAQMMEHAMQERKQS